MLDREFHPHLGSGGRGGIRGCGTVRDEEEFVDSFASAGGLDYAAGVSRLVVHVPDVVVLQDAPVSSEHHNKQQQQQQQHRGGGRTDRGTQTNKRSYKKQIYLNRYILEYLFFLGGEGMRPLSRPTDRWISPT